MSAETVVLTPPGTNKPSTNQNIFSGFFNQPNLQNILPESTYANLLNHTIMSQLPQANQPALQQSIEGLLPNLPFGMNPIALQSLLQTEALKTETGMQPQIVMKETKQIKGSLSDPMLDFQIKTLGFLETQNKMIIDLGEKNGLIHDTLACLISEITSLK